MKYRILWFKGRTVYIVGTEYRLITADSRAKSLRDFDEAEDGVKYYVGTEMCEGVFGM